MLTDTPRRYGLISVVLHWLTAILLVYLFLDGNQLEDLRDPVAHASVLAWHVAAGATASILLIGRIIWRVVVTPPAPFSSSTPLNLLARLVRVGLLATLAVAIVSGFLAIWLLGQPVDLFGYAQLTSPFPASQPMHRLSSGIHGLTVHLLIPLTLLHVLGAAKHMIIDRDGTMRRMVWPAP